MKFEKLDAKASVERAKKAQKSFEYATQERADAAVKAICRVVYQHAEELAKMAIEETGMGVYENKLEKCIGKSQMVWHDLKTKKTVGIIDVDEEKRMWTVAKPVGIVGAVTPCTNPVVTVMSNAAFALKCRDAIIFAPHPRAINLTDYMMQLFEDELEKLGEDPYLVSACRIDGVEDTTELMSLCDVVVATGGPGMVKSAYSSGKPAYGVGAGNVQVMIDKGVDYSEVAKNVVGGRSYDNGILCTCEQAIHIPEDEAETILNEFKKNGAYILEDKGEEEILRNLVFPDGKTINRAVVGQTALTIAKLAGISVPENTKIIMINPKGLGEADCFGKEKMCPIMAIYPYKTFEEGVEHIGINLSYEGEGHSANIYSNDKAHQEYMAIHTNVSRLVANHTSSSGAGGNVWNGYTPTNTLGCGSWGGNSFSDNFTYKYLMNTTKMGFKKDEPLKLDPKDLLD